MLRLASLTRRRRPVALLIPAVARAQSSVAGTPKAGASGAAAFVVPSPPPHVGPPPKHRLFAKLMAANRGEIAIRVLRAAMVRGGIVCACVRACVRACVCACAVRACVRACAARMFR